MKLNLMTMITGSALVAVLWVNPGMTFDLPGDAWTLRLCEDTR